MTIAEFADGVGSEIADYLAPAMVAFRGSFADHSFDEFSDVDLETQVDTPLDAAFFAGLEQRLRDRYGAALVRYDPDDRQTTTAQDLRVSFYGLPIFWRVDLRIASTCATAQKHPNPFPDWSIGASALMNVVWALKHLRRGRHDEAAHYLSVAGRKIGLPQAACTLPDYVDHLAARNDVDLQLLAKTREALAVLPSAHTGIRQTSGG